MKRTIIGLATVLALPLSAYADNVGGCGLGSKLFDGQKGVFPQVFAITTNNWAFNTFAISSGTSGCSQDGVVKSNWASRMFIDGNMNRLALDVSRGDGETLHSLGRLLEVGSADQLAFNAALKSNFAVLFPSPSTSSAETIAALRTVLESDAVLSKYAVNV